jgi:hypothetical protein
VARRYFAGIFRWVNEYFQVIFFRGYTRVV